MPIPPRSLRITSRDEPVDGMENNMREESVASRRTIAYVFPIYNETGNIPLLYERIVEVTRPLEARYSFEFIFVDDGSRDDSLRLLQGLRERDPRVSVYAFA